MWQSQVTEYFQGRKRNSNFQPSKRQKVEVESCKSDLPKNGTLQASKASTTKKNNIGVVRTRSTTVIPNRVKKRNTGSGIQELQTNSKSHNVRLNDIWPKSCDTSFSSALITDADHISTKFTENSSVCPLTSSKQQLNVIENRKSSISSDHEDVSVTATNGVRDGKLAVSLSKRHVRYNEAAECEINTVSDVATAVIDDHGNSHPCTPSKRRTVQSGSVSVVVDNKRGRSLVPTNSTNYYKTPQKFDFSPYQCNTSNRQSSSARKKLVLSNVDVKKSPPVFFFKGSTEKSRELSVAVEYEEKSHAEVRKKAKDVIIESLDKTEAGETDETAVSKRENKEAKTPSKNASSVVKIGTCRNLEQLKKKLQDLSPRKSRASGTGDDGSSANKRY